MADETKKGLNLESHRINRIFPLNRFPVGEFTVLPFELVHDVPNVGFFIHHIEMGNLLYITDTTYCKYKFDKINHIMIEANFCDEIIEDDFLSSRIYRSHMSINNCIKFLQANDLSNVQTITLIHLSDRNSNAKEFKEKVQKATGKLVEIAENGLVIKF